MSAGGSEALSVPPFDRHLFTSAELCTRIGGGELGGKALGLLAARDLVSQLEHDPAWNTLVTIPRMIVVATSVFDAFMDRNGLWELAESDTTDERIAHGFQKAAMPAEVTGDLRALVEETHSPLAIRSSSRLEDAMRRPLAGVYTTKMIANNQTDADSRFQRLVEALKFVFASTFFRSARRYVRAIGRSIGDERMAALIQEVVGSRHGDRFYPTVSGVAKSYNFYPIGDAARTDGVIDLALGLGKTIVDGERCWTCSPGRATVPLPFSTMREYLENTQLRFWAVNVGRPPAHDPVAETEYLVHAELGDAEYDGTLAHVASTYDADADRMTPGIGRAGARVVDFAPLLKLRTIPLTDVVQVILERCRERFNGAVEIEFAVSIDLGCSPAARFGFLQVRPMVVSEALVDISPSEWTSPQSIVASTRALGNGVVEPIADVVYVKPDTFDAQHTCAIAEVLGEFNDALTAEHRPYLLIGFGRWGSSDPSLGIPVDWGDIAGARVIVEATLPQMDIEASQGAHFFHNLSSFEVGYLTVHHDDRPGIDWTWLSAQPAVRDTPYVRHVRVTPLLHIKVDGRTGRGGVWRAK